LAAGQLANPIGDWTLIGRDDGVRQWAYKGHPIYTFDGDLKPGDVTGVGIDKQRHVAMLVRYFMPPNAAIAKHPSRGPLLATADGHTLYRRDSHVFRSGGHSLGSSLPYHSAVGRMIGTRGCDAECLKTWHPFAAPADAIPTGYWTVLTREDGVRQWAYRGYAMYTYEGDKKPGDNNGNDIFDILVNDGVHQVAQAQIGAQQDDAFALFWHNAEP
jgi:predicted lipoprotein with Yx(FWY)xxD motif